MSRSSGWSLLLLAVLLCPSHGAEPSPTPMTPAQDVEIRFHNGSVVRPALVLEPVTIVTKHGSLKIVPRDIIRIEFGMNPPEMIAKKVEEGIQGLTSENFQRREDAGKDLLALGRYAYPSVLRLHKSKNDLETTRRVEVLVKEFQRKLPAYQMKMKEEDVIHTNESMIAGRIVSSVKVKTDLFGEVTLQLTHVRGLFSLDDQLDYEVTIDASKNGLANNLWLETDFVVKEGRRVQITANGQVDVWTQQAGQYLSGPDGTPNAARNGRYMAGTLLGRVGDSGMPFIIGSRYDNTPNQEGKLFLWVVPVPNNNTAMGTYHVRISSTLN